MANNIFMKKKVIIDCDVGVDDALALILAFNSPELDVKAITAVNGNVPLDQVFENIKKVLSLIKPKEKPFIARGADQPLKGKPVYAHSVHGKDGLGGAKLDLREGEKWWEIFSDSADNLITEIAHNHPDEFTLIATGPLTNLALALRRDCEGMRKLKEIVIMGGALRTGGNITPFAEFNIFSDPLAARKVFESGLPITLVPLDVTHRVFLGPELIEERLKPINNSFSKFVIDAIGYNLSSKRFLRGSDLIYLHDPLAIGVVIDPSLVKKESFPLNVETEDEKYYGMVKEMEDGPKIDVCVKVDSGKFLSLFLSRLQ